MSDEHTVHAKLYPDGRIVEEMSDGTERPIEDDTDWERIANMSEEEIIANALSDPDNPPRSWDELSQLDPVPDARTVRKRLKLTQVQFAKAFGIPLGTLRDWEQLPIVPDRAAASYLRVIEQNPDAVIAALQAYRSGPSDTIEQEAEPLASQRR